MTEIDPKHEFWNSFLRAAEVEPRSARAIRGRSGFSHPIVGVGVDDDRRRVVVISGESDARSAVLANADIQAALPDMHVIMARPSAINLGEAARILSEQLGKLSFGQQDLDWLTESQENLQERVNEALEPLKNRIVPIISGPYAVAALNLVAVWKEIIQQLSLIEIESAPASDEAKLPTLRLDHLATLDPVAMDRRNGVCSVPLYDLSQQQIETLQQGSDLEAVRSTLSELGILQYFFPAADQLALGFADQATQLPSEIVAGLIKTPTVGHPFGAMDFVDSSLDLNDVVVSLQERGLLVEGEVGIAITESGREVRGTVKFRPREGLLARLSQVFSVKINLSAKDLLE